jgi:hypothetical protein
MPKTLCSLPLVTPKRSLCCTMGLEKGVPHTSVTQLLKSANRDQELQGFHCVSRSSQGGLGAPSCSHIAPLPGVGGNPFSPPTGKLRY